jgi:hypothetical protein
MLLLLHVKAAMAEEVEKPDLGLNTVPFVLRNAI